MSGILATKVELNSKHVYVNNLCSFCNTAEESIMHVLVSCNFAKSCWVRSSLNIISFSQHYFYSWFQDLMSSNSGEQLEEALMVAWAIWNARNNLLWNQKSTTAAEVILSARTHLYQWQCAQQSKLEPPLSHFEIGKEAEHWTKPERNMVKINVDGAIFEAMHSFGFGFIARDCHGEIIEAGSFNKNGTSSPELVELIGIKEALSWIKDKSWGRIVLESDCLLAVQAIHTNVALPSTFGMLVQDCQHLLSQMSHISLCFVKRSANKAAHFFALNSCYLSDRFFVKDTSPYDLLRIVLDDIKV
ncbi:hypothetical protein CsatA_020065 [Cannabis sativa]